MPERARGGVLRNLGVLGLSQVVTQLLHIVALVLVARTLGVAGFGTVQVGVVVSTYALLVSELGLMSLGIREVARMDSPVAVRDYVRRHVGLLLVLALAGFTLGALLLPLTPFFADAPAVFLLYLAFVGPQVFMFEWVSTGLQHLTWTGIYWVTRALVYAGLVVVLIPRAEGLGGLSALTWVPLSYLVAFVVADVVLALRIGRMLPGGPLTPLFGPWSTWKDRLGHALPIGLSIVIMRVLLNVDVLLLGLLTEAEVVGVYAAASKIVIVLIVASNVVWKVLLPRLSRMWSRSPTDFHATFGRYVGWAVIALAPLAVGGYLLGPRFIEMLYDDRYLAAGPVFRVLSLAYPALALGVFFGNGLIASDRQGRYLPTVILAAAGMVGLNLALIPRLGAIGAAWGAVGGAGLLVVATAWQMRAVLTRALLTPLVVTTVACTLLGVVLQRLQHLPQLVLIGVGAMVYAGVAGPFVLRRSTSE